MWINIYEKKKLKKKTSKPKIPKLGKNIILVKILINKIFKYSAIKIKTNNSEENSTLNPLTNSDSPSTKSKGVRLVSAKIQINHKKKTKKEIKINPILNSNKTKITLKQK